MHSSRGFTLLEMIVVLVIMGIITSLALPGLQKMYDGMRTSLDRNELVTVLNSLALNVRNYGHPVLFSAYPADAAQLPSQFVQRLDALNVSLQFDSPLLITSSGFCPAAVTLNVIKGTQSYRITMRSPDCRVIAND